MNIGELFVTLGFNADTKKVKDFAKAVGDLPLDIAGAIIALAGIEIELTKIAEQAMNTAAGFQMFTSQTGLSWQELQRWQIVAEQANVSTEAVASSINALERNMAEIRLGRGNIAPFQMLGIGMNQNAFGVLNQLRDRIKGMNRATATNMISQMGLSPEMIQVLSLTNREFEKLSRNVAGISGEQEGSFLRAKQTLVQFGQVARYVGFELVGHLGDGMQMLIERWKDFKVVIITVGLVLAGVAAYFFPITASIVGLILVLDDLAVYFKGGDSVIGLAIEGIKKLATALDPFAGKMGNIGKVMGIAGLVLNPVSTIGTYAANLAGQGISNAITQHNTINVHSSAPAADVGKAVKHELDKGVSQAALQTNNQGF